MAEVLPFIERAARFNTGAAPFDPQLVAQSGPAYVLEVDGVPACGYVLEVQDNDVFILAAGGSAKLDFTQVGLKIIEAQAAEHFEYVSFATKRPGLIKKARKLGYDVAGVILRKKLK